MNVNSTGRRCVLAASAALLVSVGAIADEMPSRKAGLWEMSMQMSAEAGMPGGGAIKSQQCVDARTDADLQRKALQGGDRMQCTQKSVKRLADGVEVEADCTSAEGRQHVSMKATGDFSRSYTMRNHVTFDPPRHGMKDATMTITATHAGACPADLAPGQVRMTGMPGMPSGMSGQGGRPAGMPPGFDPRALQGMSPEQLQKMAEQMQRGAGR